MPTIPMRSFAIVSFLAVLLSSAPLLAGDDLFVPVSPSDELTILDPRTNAEGKPQPRMYTDATGERQVDIPPTVIVHNFYYSGDRDFRGPRLPGGPTILVVKHPVTSERQYLEVQMLPGSPRITYRKCYIDYNFGEASIRVRFINPVSLCDRHAATVHYDDGEREDLDPQANRHRQLRDWIHRTGVPDTIHQMATTTKGSLDSAADRFRTAGQVLTAPITGLMQSTPLGGLISDSDVDRAATARNAAVQRAADQLERRDLTIPTLR